MVSVALIQMDIKLGDKDYNLEYALKKSKEIIERENNIDLIVFPELFTTGYASKHKIQNVLAEEIPGGITIEILTKFAKNNSIALIGSIIEKGDPLPYNTMIVIDKNGNLVEKYRKIHLFKPMGEHLIFQAGSNIKAASLPNIGRIGLSICYDIRFPELTRKLAIEEDINIIIVVSEFPKPREDHWQTLLKARAIENQCFVIGVNRVGRDKYNEYFGLSMTITPTGEILNNTTDEEGVFFVEFNLKEVSDFRKKIPCFEDIRKDIFSYKK